MTTHTITISGKPQACHRPRFSRKLGRAYDSQKDVRDNMTYQAATQWPHKPIEVACSIFFVFKMQLPKATSKKKRALLNGMPCLNTTDTSNLVKLAEDCLLGPVLKDDNIVWNLSACKIWADEGSTEITISWDEPLFCLEFKGAVTNDAWLDNLKEGRELDPETVKAFDSIKEEKKIAK